MEVEFHLKSIDPKTDAFYTVLVCPNKLHSLLYFAVP